MAWVRVLGCSICSEFRLRSGCTFPLFTPVLKSAVSRSWRGELIVDGAGLSCPGCRRFKWLLSMSCATRPVARRPRSSMCQAIRARITAGHPCGDSTHLRPEPTVFHLGCGVSAIFLSRCCSSSSDMKSATLESARALMPVKMWSRPPVPHTGLCNRRWLLRV